MSGWVLNFLHYFSNIKEIILIHFIKVHSFSLVNTPNPSQVHFYVRQDLMFSCLCSRTTVVTKKFLLTHAISNLQVGERQKSRRKQVCRASCI